jgi:hypothetical protein
MSLDRTLMFLTGPWAILGEEVMHSNAFQTEKVRVDQSEPISIRLNPSGTREETAWSFMSLFTFLNELTDDWVIFRNRSERLPAKPDPRQLNIYYADGNGAGKKRIIVTITTDWVISVHISRPDLVGWNDWIVEVGPEQFLIGTRGRVNKLPRQQILMLCRWLTRNIRGGNAWIKHASFVPIDAHEFHPIVLALARKLVMAQLPQ